MVITKENIKAMTAAEREELLANFWSVVAEEPYTDEAPDDSAEELNLVMESLEEYQRDPSSAKTWEELMLDLRARING